MFKLPRFPKINKDVFLWGLYDFANTPLTVAMGGLFLAQWIVLDNGVADIWYGGVFTLATILLLLTSPFLGAWSDKLGRRMPFLRWTTFIFIIVGVAIGLVAVSSMPKIPRVALVLGLFFLMQYVYQVSLIFYNSLLDRISAPETRGKVSGIGEAFGEVGWLLGPAMLLPFAMGYATFFGEPGRAQVFLPATLVLIFFGLPMIFGLKEPKDNVLSKDISVRAVYKEAIEGFKSLIKRDKNVTNFLLSFMFISDALLTANLYFAIYLDQIFKISDFQKFLVLALMEIICIISSLIVGKMSDKYGSKKLLIVSCINLTLIYFLISFTSSLTFTFFLAALVGFGYGGFYTTSRVLLVKLSPPSKLGEYFGFYSTFQKFASIIGPLTWGAVTLLLRNHGELRYRMAILSLSLLMLIGTLIMTRVKEEKPAV